MPPKKKVARSNKKKKGGEVAKQKQERKEKKAAAAADGGPLLPKDITDSNVKPDDVEVGCYYQQYKRATAAVKEGLRSLLPSSFKLTSVNDLARAATFILDESLEVELFIQTCNGEYIASIHDKSPQEQLALFERFEHVFVPDRLIGDLHTSISLRCQVMDRYKNEGAADTGHRYITNILKYCQRALKASRKITKNIQGVAKKILWMKNSSGKIDTEKIPVPDSTVVNNDDGFFDRFSNRFAEFLSLYEDEESEEEEEAESDMEKIIQERKSGVDSSPISEGNEAHSIEDLIRGSDRLQACSFLFTMEHLMSLVSDHYSLLKRDVRAIDSTDPKMLMQCAMIANTCIYSVQRAEAALAIDYPYLSSFYSVLAVVFMPPLLKMFEERHLSSAPEIVRKKCDKATLISFLGKIMQCSFHNKGNLDYYAELKNKFSKKTGLTKEQVEDLSFRVKLATDLEVQSSWEKEMEENKIFHREIGGKQLSHNWLRDHEFIGGSRSLLNTLRWLQTIISISDNTKLLSKPGFFGKIWDEDRNQADSIQGDMDELYCGSIVPELLEWCKPRTDLRIKAVTLLDSISPYSEQTIPVKHMLNKHMKENKNGPVPAHLAFGMHCLLTSIIEMQGNEDVTRHALNAKKSWTALFNQLETRAKNDDIPNHFSFFVNVLRFVNLRHLPSEIGEPSTPTSSLMAFFNPLMAGSYLLFANYVMGIALGSCTVDSIGQLRFVMHLFNAFKRVGLLNDVPLLKETYTVFKDSKALWVLKEKPDVGEFCKRFLIAWGFNLKEAEKTMKIMCSPNAKLSHRPQSSCRNLDPILPEQMSASYRLIMNRDFKGIVDDYSVKNVTPEERKKHDDYFRTLSNINMTRDKMDDDEDNVLFINWTVVGCIFNHFTRALMKEFGWDRFVQKLILTCPDSIRYGLRSDGSRAQGKFDVSDANLEYQAYSQIISMEILHKIDKNPNCEIGRRCAEFMRKYFTTVDKKTYSFFIDDSEEKISHDSPSACNLDDDSLNPYIRGTKVLKTTPEVRDPIDIDVDYPKECDGHLVSSMVLKFTKSNASRARMVKHGKLTPPSFSGVHASEKPPQLVCLENGKYRHIASFSLKELRQLGWDGAMYRSDTLENWVPYIEGYDSDDEDEYESFDRRKARKERTLGLPMEEAGKIMSVPNLGDLDGGVRYVQLKK